MRILLLLSCLVSLSLITSARAELRVTVSNEPDQRLVLSRLPASFQAELVGLAENDVPMFDVAKCETLGSRHITLARATDPNMDVIVARYNLVNMWTNNLCGGTTDVMPTGTEAKAWLEELAGLSRQEDGAPFIDARRRLAEVLVFGAPGVEPDLARAQTYLADEAKRDPSMLLFAAHMAERGLATSPDRARSLALIREGAARGNADARALLAQAQELGLDVAQDEAAAAAQYEQLSRATVPPVWFRLGRMLLDGRGVKADPCRAREFLQLAAEHAFTPVPVAREYLDQISDQKKCPAS
ncbi:MAG: hypothetical protein KGR68_16645 [Betaproteobacteria bacterium]|nr:hypothetical protein [Betaproteobacteria bacterium]